MRLLYHWFCRIIGVGSAFDIMKLYVMMLIWIVGALIAFFPEEVNGKKHRSAHRPGHHRHHHHHRHHKHPKLHHHLPINGNLTVKTKRNSLFAPKNFNVTNIVNTKPWILAETSTTLFVNSSFTDKEEIESLHRKMSTEKISFVPNSEQTSNGLKNSSSFNNYTEINNNSKTSTFIPNSNYKNTSHSDFKNIFVASQITMRVIEESTTQFFSQAIPSTSGLQEAEEIKKDVSADSLNNYFNITEVEEEKVAKDLQNLFGPPKDQTYSTDSVIDNNNPVVELIRKKRSVVMEKEDKSVDGKIRKETLQDFSGPKILNDPEEIEDLDEPNAVHKRVKRDGSELDDDDRSALLSLDSTYLRNLEDSFPLSALEIQAQRSQMSGRRKNTARSKRDIELNAEEENPKNGPAEPINESIALISEEDNLISNNRVNDFRPSNSRPFSELSLRNNNHELKSSSGKNTLTDSVSEGSNRILPNRVTDVEDSTDSLSTNNVDKESKTIFFAADLRTSTSSILLTRNVSSISRNGVNDVEDSTNNPSIMDLIEEQKTTYLQAKTQKTPANFLPTEVNSILRNRVNSVYDLDPPSTDLDNTTFSAKSQTFVNNANPVSENRVNVAHPADISSNSLSYKDDVGNDSAIGSTTSTPTEWVLKDINPVLENRVNDISRLNKNQAQPVRNNEVNREQSSIKDVEEHPQRSPSDNSIVKDDDSISRYGLDDVYPEIIQDSENPSPMVQLVRTKRFGDSIVYPEAPDASYANEIDNRRTADEPYAEDNRIIDSMLSKVEYRNVDEQDAGSDNESPFSEDEIDADKQNYDKREEVAIRGKRSKSSKRTRKKKGNNRRSYGKQEKSHKDRAKKDHSKRCKKHRASRNLSKRDFDIDNSLSDMKRVDGQSQLNDNDEDVISSRERRRRESENEDEDNYYSESIETAGRVRRDIRKNPEPNSDDNISPNAVVNMEPKIRGKRKTVVQKLKNFENVRQVNVEQNRKEETTDLQKADVPIQDIRKLVVELLTKVDDLLGYAVENGGGNEQSNISKLYDMPNNTNNVLQRNTNSQIAGNTAPRQAYAITRSEACWKHPTSRNSEFKAKKNSRPVRNLRSQRCGKNMRRKRKSHHKWDRWTDWSSCSVTCGRGRQIRWRHCVRNCSNAETEMEEKACQLPACAPGKFLGIFG